MADERFGRAVRPIPAAAPGGAEDALELVDAQHPQPLLKFIDRPDADTPDRSVGVLIPEPGPTPGFERRLRAPLLKHGGPRLNVMTSP